MSDRFDSVDLSLLPTPAVVEPLDYPTLKAAYIAELKAVLLEAGFTWDMDVIEADPGSAMAEATGFRELVLRGRINDAAKAVMLAYSDGTDLDNLAALYKVLRLPGETDDGLRSRVHLAPEALSVAGPSGAYAFHARSVSASIVDVAVYSPYPGAVYVVPLIASGDGRPSDDLINQIYVAINDEFVRPLTDMVSVIKPRLVQFSLVASLLLAPGPDHGLVLAAAQASLAAYYASRRKVGAAIYRSGLYAALQVGGVDDVVLSSPAADVVVARDQVALPISSTVTVVRSS